MTALASKADFDVRSCDVAEVPKPAVSSRSTPRVRKAELFDYLIGGSDQGRRNGEAEHPRGPGAA
jgi:hypothetical protein